LAVRQDEPRNTPTVINAVFNHRNFWDGRANNTFNGVGVFGMRDILGDPAKRLVVLNGDGSLKLDFLQLANASLASQAVGPPLSTLEMSCANRTFADIGRRLLALALKPLKNQRVDRNDSVLGPFAHPAGKGLKNEHGYEALIRQAFDEKYWAARGTYRITSQGRLEQVSPGNGVGRGGYTQTELNFPMFWGIAIMLYEATLISNQSDYDDRLNSGRLTPLDSPPFGCTGTMGDAVDRGCALFFSPRNGCLFCHGGKDLFSAAAFQQGEPFPTVGRFGPHTHDSGFFNVGVRPVFSDLVNGGIDPYGNPLSFTRQLKTGNKIDPNLDGVNFPGGTTGVDGTSKAPSMRNVALTPPYFADGSHASLRQVLKFYNRGGNRRDIGDGVSDAYDKHGTGCTTGDDTGTGPDGEGKYPLAGVTDCSSNTSVAIRPLGLTNIQLTELEAFLKSLTDPRVQCDKAPFDHPSLHVINGHLNEDRNNDGRADERVFELPAVGAGGYATNSGLCVPNAADLFAPGMQSRAGG
jgi:cytochrome c peroxidase